MNILIKPQLDYPVMSNSLPGVHDYIDQLWSMHLLQSFRELGHNTYFIQKKQIEPYSISDTEGYNVLIFDEITSFYQDKVYSISLLKSFKGIKVLYIPTFTSDYPEITSLFDYIFVADSPLNIIKWSQFHPHVKALPITWHSPRNEFLDNDISYPYKTDKFKIVYFGIVRDAYLNVMMRLAEDGEQVYFGGMYYTPDNVWTKAIPQEKIDKFSPNLHMVSNGTFECGSQYKWMKYAELGLVFYPINFYGAVSHKIVEYLCCGTRCLIEEPCPNAFRATQLNGGKVYPYRDYDALYQLIQNEKKLKYNKNELQNEARATFDIKSVCQTIINSL